MAPVAAGYDVEGEPAFRVADAGHDLVRAELLHVPSQVHGHLGPLVLSGRDPERAADLELAVAPDDPVSVPVENLQLEVVLDVRLVPGHPERDGDGHVVRGRRLLRQRHAVVAAAQQVQLASHHLRGVRDYQPFHVHLATLLRVY